MQQIEVTITPEGESKVEVVCGPGGPACHVLTAAIERAIGTTTGDQLKPEFHRQQGQSQQQASR